MRRTLFPLALTTAATLAAQPKTTFHFDLTAISPTALYSETTGFGYEKPASGVPPYYFSVRVPEEGNYRVTLSLGAPDVETTATIKAELRRLMVERVDTKPGEFLT